MAVVYKHFTKDTNELFYVGIGTNIKRAYSKKQRNSLWQNIINKHGYYVVIYLKDVSDEIAKQTEIELIKQYGRRDNFTGILCNMTDGGDLRRFSDATKNRIANSLKGKQQSEETKAKRKATSIRTWQSPELRELKRQQTTLLIKKGIIKTTKGVPSPKKGKPFKGDKTKLSNSLKEYYKKNEIYNKKHIAVIKMDLDGVVLNTYKSHQEAAKEINGYAKRILQVCNGKLKKHRNFKWKYYE
jgi:hypothetical protein